MRARWAPPPSGPALTGIAPPPKGQHRIQTGRKNPHVQGLAVQRIGWDKHSTRPHLVRRLRAHARQGRTMAADQASRSPIIRQSARTRAMASRAAADRAPCFRALQWPLGAPLPLPPCILHRALPFTAGERHGWPDRVRAWQRGACASRLGSGCMGLFACSSIFLPPGVMVEFVGNHRLPAFVDVNVPDGLLARLVQLGPRA